MTFEVTFKTCLVRLPAVHRTEWTAAGKNAVLCAVGS